MLETTANEFRKTLKAQVDKCIADHEILRSSAVPARTL